MSSRGRGDTGPGDGMCRPGIGFRTGESQHSVILCVGTGLEVPSIAGTPVERTSGDGSNRVLASRAANVLMLSDQECTCE